MVAIHFEGAMHYKARMKVTMPDTGEKIDNELIKAALKEGIQEWLDEQFARFGKWTLAGLLSAGIAGLVFVILMSQGWHK